MHIIFIGGLADNSIGIVKNYYKEFIQIYPSYSSEYFQWHEKKDLKERLKAIAEEGMDKRVVLIGHSYGGATATQVLKEIEVDLLITIDPVSRVWSRQMPKAKKWININDSNAKKYFIVLRVYLMCEQQKYIFLYYYSSFSLAFFLE